MPIHLVSANIGQNQPLPANGRIELGFDRLLLPASITRQTFVLSNAGGNIAYTPTVAYDPVARIVTITPLTDPSQALVSGQNYDLVILGPQNPSDVNGLRAIDGAGLAKTPQIIAFSVIAATPTPPPTVSIDFCRDIFPITSLQCTLPICHGTETGNFPAAGLALDPPSGIPATAVGRVAQGSNTGPQSIASPPTLLFAEDMPIIDATGNINGNPGNSWLMYKVLLAPPSPPPVVVDAGVEDAPASEDAGAPDATLATDAGPGPDAGLTADGGTTDGAVPAGSVDAGVTDAGAMEAGTAPPPVVPPPVDVGGAHGGVAFNAISATERATLSNYILGRQMPFPPAAPPSQQTGLTVDEMERLSLWIAQGASAPANCPPPGQ